MITNADVTVYNRIGGDSTHYDTWIRTVLHGVHVHVDHKTAVTDNGLKSAEVYKIRIPTDIPEAGQYLPPDQFACCGGYDTGPYRMMIRLSWESVRLRLKGLQI